MTSTARELATREPWRTGLGQPKNALQLDWLTEVKTCPGDIKFDAPVGDKPPWWLCEKCGYCGCFTNVTHAAPPDPAAYYHDSIEFYYKRRGEQGVPSELAKYQAGHLMGAALRAAAKLTPDELSKFVHSLLQYK